MTGGSLISFASGLAAVPPDAAQLTGTVTIPEGGTGQTTAAAALTALGGAPASGGTFTNATLSGTTTLASATISGGATVVGTYTGGTYSGATISGGAINGAVIGGTSAVAGTFTTLTATTTAHVAALVTVQGAPAAKTASTTLTATEVLGGIITANQGSAGAAVYTMPLGTALGTALPNFAANDAFQFSLVNISVTISETATLATNTGITLVGGMTVLANSAAGVAASAPFLVRMTAPNAFTVYRMG